MHLRVHLLLEYVSVTLQSGTFSVILHQCEPNTVSTRIALAVHDL